MYDYLFLGCIVIFIVSTIGAFSVLKDLRRSFIEFLICWGAMIISAFFATQIARLMN